MFIPDKITPELTKITTSTSIITGQYSIAVDSTTEQVTGSSVSLKNGVIIQADTTNTGVIYVGGSGVDDTNGFKLYPGGATSVGLSDISYLYVYGTANDSISFIATGG